MSNGHWHDTAQLEMSPCAPCDPTYGASQTQHYARGEDSTRMARDRTGWVAPRYAGRQFTQHGTGHRIIRLDLPVQRGPQAGCNLLAQLNAELVERIDIPYQGLQEDAVLVHRQQRAQCVR